jgi:hypothetical protein
MRRIPGALTALAVAALAGPARGAEISRVATSGEPGNPFDLDLGVRWDRSVESATIVRERASTTPPVGTIVDGSERLRYSRTRDALVPRVAIGLWKDLELHAELPYVLGDDRAWRYGSYNGKTSGPNPSDPQSIAGNTINAAGRPCASPPCPLFPVDPETTDYHGGRTGDLLVGIAWAPFNELKDDTKPTWVVGMDVTAPTAQKWDPAAGRTPDTWESPYRFKTNPGPVGEKIWKWDLYTVLSKRYGYVDPYVKAHARMAFKSSQTFSNCDHVDEATAATLQAQQMNDDARSNCASWSSKDTGAQLPFVAGVMFGSEVIPYEEVSEGQKVSLDFRFYADLTSRQRFYNELSDATGKFHMTSPFMEVGGLGGLYLRASRYVLLTAQASLAIRTAHDLSGEDYYKGGWPAAGQAGPPGSDPKVNPNFDWRYDAPGRRFRIQELTVFDMSFGAVLQF